MMTVTTSDVRKLIEHRGEPCVSVYMSTDPVWPGGPSDRVRLRNLLRDAARRLAVAHPRRAVERLLVPVAERVRASWPPRGRGIALLRSPELDLGFQLPVEVPDLAVVAPTFHTKPLLAYLDRSQHFYVLALAGTTVRLLDGTAERLVDVTAAAIPASLGQEEPDPRRAERVVGAPGGATAGPAMQRRAQDDRDRARRSRLRSRFAAVDDAVGAFLRPAEAPLVLAGVRAERELYRSVSRYPRIVEEGLDGDVARLAAHELHAQAWPIVCAEQAALERDAALHYLAFLRAGQATDVLSEVIAAAGEGRVRLLLHREGAHLWGRMDAGRGTFVLRSSKAETAAGDSDLIDDLCELTLARGGDVMELAPERMPTEVPVAAVLRY